MQIITTRLARAIMLAALAAAASAWGQTDPVLEIDASGPVPKPENGYFHMGASVAPNGERLEINSQYLTRNGMPWLPVMGEFHFTRSPAVSWESELYKMKSAGINAVSTYIIWNHHEEQEGQFNWRGNRDLRHFVQLCRKVGLDVVLRIGPWSHAEVRYGGIPDWMVDSMPTRGNDPQYLRYVERLYGQIAVQVQGQLWKQGGPIIGIQLENEYNLSGAGQGAAHIQTLKMLALKAGLDVPLYTVTGWDGTVYPSGEVTPVFGGYPDEPWGTSTTELPPKETYAFRFGSRVSGDLGAQTVAAAPGTAETDAVHTPFLGAEYGAGLPAMYRRRTVVSSDDIASMLPVQLGSGVNLLGYYMFHGGRNPVGGTTLEESTLSGGYNDTPKLSYDFQAPLGPDGQQRPVLARLKPFHYFLNDFGDRLAPMAVRKPEHVPTDPADLDTPRWSVRSQGDSGFLFFNNHVRQYAMAERKGVRFSITLPGETLVFPSHPVDVPEDSYFIWPFNFDLEGTRLRYATAQPVARLDAGKEGVVFVFVASAGMPVEFGFAADVASLLSAPAARIEQQGSDLRVAHIQPDMSAALTIKRPQARTVTVLVLSPEQARQLSIGQMGGQRRLVLSEQEAYFSNGMLEMRSAGSAKFRAAIYPPLKRQPQSTSALKTISTDGVFQVIEAEQAERHVDATLSKLRPAQSVPAVQRGGLAQAALQPTPESFRSAAAWQISVPPAQLQGLDGAYLQIDFAGDIGRLFAGTRMLDDWYYSGYQWQVGLKQFESLLNQPLTLTVLPLRADAPIYIPKESRPDFGGQAQLAALRNVAVVPVYRLELKP